MKKYIMGLIVPILWEVLFIISCMFFLTKDYFVYTNFLFYFGIIVYFVLRKNFSIRELRTNIISGKKFWIPVLVTLLGSGLAYGISCLPEMFFHNLYPGMIPLRTNGWIQLIFYAISTIIFPCLAEELFYRKAMINFKNKKILFLSTIVSLFLFGSEHALRPYGIFMAMIWGIPFSIAYIKTKNVYIPMAAHFIGDFVMNVPMVILMIVKFLH